MGKRVRLLPSGQEFYVEGQETLIAAAIRGGVALPYGCSNGNCGLCMVKILDGQVKRVQHQDYVFSAAQKRDQFVLMCTNTPVTDLVIEAHITEDVGDIAEQHFRVKVRKLEKISDELLILHVRMPRGERMRFIAGQYATIGIPNVGEYVYSIASCPCDDKHLEFHIRHVKGEVLSEYIFKDLKPRAFLELTGPKGQFVLLEDAHRPMIMIAFDTGFAAIKSLLEHATAQEKEREIHLYWIACGTEGQYLNNLCRAWQDALDEFHYTPLNISKDIDEMQNPQLRVCETTRKALLQVVDDHPDLSGYDLYLSAPESILESAQTLFLQHNLDTDRMKTDTVHGTQNISCLANLASE